MKKDKIIESKLNQIANNMILDDNIIDDAIIEMRHTNQSKSIRQSSFTFRFRNLLPVAYAIIIIIVIAMGSNLVINSLRNNTPSPSPTISPGVTPTPPPPYDLSNLKLRAVSSDDLHIYTDNPILAFDYEQMSAIHIVGLDKNTDQTMMIMTEYTIVGSHSTDKINLIANIGNIYEFDYPYNKFEHNDVTVYYNESYIDGEYITIAYFTLDEIEYSLYIMSPISGQIYDYSINLLN